MSQPMLPRDKTFRMRVALVNEAGEHVPFEGGFVLVPEDRLVLLERLATAARNLVVRHKDAIQNPAEAGRVETALKKLGDEVSALQGLWEIPQG